MSSLGPAAFSVQAKSGIDQCKSCIDQFPGAILTMAGMAGWLDVAAT